MSQGEIILAALLRGERLSKLDAYRMGAGLSINSRIADLRKRGYIIDCDVEMRDGRRVWVYQINRPAMRFEQAMTARVSDDV